MPVGRTTTTSEVRAIAMVVIALLVLLGGVAAFFTLLSNQGDLQIRLGDDYFDAGDAVDIADEIADNGPVLWSDPAGGTRDVYINHLGEDPESGWVAFDVRLPGDSRDCHINWVAAAEQFIYTCDPQRSFPPDGAGLTPYPVTIVDGHIIIDINAAQRASTSTTLGRSDSSVVISGS